MERRLRGLRGEIIVIGSLELGRQMRGTAVRRGDWTRVIHLEPEVRQGIREQVVSMERSVFLLVAVVEALVVPIM